MADPVYPQKFSLVVGLGNPGKTYYHNRHNVGFLWLDEYVVNSSRLSFSNNSRFLSEVACVAGTFFIKPQTFMNLSGNAVKKITRFHQIPPEQVLVIHDELDLPFSNLKMKFAGGSAGHNGIKDIAKQIGPEFWRLRVGIGRPIDRQPVTDFVLNNFPQSELEDILRKSEYFWKNYWDKIQEGKLANAIASLASDKQ